MTSALQKTAPVTRGKYERVFAQLLPDIETIVPQLSELVQGSLVGSDMAIYVLQRGDKEFQIVFVRHADGVWRIEEM